ncbi:MAG: hypothetical protein K2M12_04210 [Muribaculaceae bacterium]|nr:hypothetical protein [Muribaculaceae bacterium]
MDKNPADVASVIAAFMNKHGADRRSLEIPEDYEFQVNGFSNVNVPLRSINILPDGAIQFNGTAEMRQTDCVSKIISNVDVVFNGNAFFATDIPGDSCLMRVCLNQIKHKTKNS